LTSYPVCERIDQEKKIENQCNSYQRELILTRHHAIKHLQHVQSGCNSQQIGNEAKNANP
jgi:hypothetical protein